MSNGGKLKIPISVKNHEDIKYSKLFLSQKV